MPRCRECHEFAPLHVARENRFLHIPEDYHLAISLRATWLRRSCLLTTTVSAASMPWTWNTFLAISKPIVVICMWTAPLSDSPMTITLWHFDAGSGRRPPASFPDSALQKVEPLTRGVPIRSVAFNSSSSRSFQKPQLR